MENIYFADQEQLKKKIEIMKQDGASKLHIVSDFDKTLTRFANNGERNGSLIAVLRNENYLNEEYSIGAKDLFDKFHPYEIDPNLDIEQKNEKMLEWWEAHYELLKKCKLSLNDLQKVVASRKATLREGFDKLLEIISKNDIMMTIITAGGLGGDTIKLFLENEGIDYSKINIISNHLIWDKDGFMIGVKEPIVHPFNKDEIVGQNEEIKDKINSRQNILLLGDGLSDLQMSKNMPVKNIIKIGYLNEKEKDLKEIFLENFDVVILNDQGLEKVNEILTNITQ